MPITRAVPVSSPPEAAPASRDDHRAPPAGVVAAAQLPRQSRAVLRLVEAGSNASCAHCGERLKFSSRTKARKVIANVYVAGRWDRVEQFHDACYDDAGAPYGPPRS